MREIDDLRKWRDGQPEHIQEVVDWILANPPATIPRIPNLQLGDPLKPIAQHFSLPDRMALRQWQASVYYNNDLHLGHARTAEGACSALVDSLILGHGYPLKYEVL